MIRHHSQRDGDFPSNEAIITVLSLWRRPKTLRRVLQQRRGVLDRVLHSSEQLLDGWITQLSLTLPFPSHGTDADMDTAIECVLSATCLEEGSEECNDNSSSITHSNNVHAVLQFVERILLVRGVIQHRHRSFNKHPLQNKELPKSFAVDQIAFQIISQRNFVSNCKNDATATTKTTATALRIMKMLRQSLAAQNSKNSVSGLMQLQKRIEKLILAYKANQPVPSKRRKNHQGEDSVNTTLQKRTRIQVRQMEHTDAKNSNDDTNNNGGNKMQTIATETGVAVTLAQNNNIDDELLAASRISSSENGSHGNTLLCIDDLSSNTVGLSCSTVEPLALDKHKIGANIETDTNTNNNMDVLEGRVFKLRASLLDPILSGSSASVLNGSSEEMTIATTTRGMVQLLDESTKRYGPVGISLIGSVLSYGIMSSLLLLDSSSGSRAQTNNGQQQTTDNKSEQHEPKGKNALTEDMVCSLTRAYLMNKEEISTIRTRAFLKWFVLPFLLPRVDDNDAHDKKTLLCCSVTSRLLLSTLIHLAREQPLSFVDSILIPLVRNSNHPASHVSSTTNGDVTNTTAGTREKNCGGVIASLPSSLSAAASQHSCELVCRIIKSKALPEASVAVVLYALVRQYIDQTWNESILSVLTACIYLKPSLSEFVLLEIAQAMEHNGEAMARETAAAGTKNKVRSDAKFGSLLNSIVTRYGLQLKHSKASANASAAAAASLCLNVLVRASNCITTFLGRSIQRSLLKLMSE